MSINAYLMFNGQAEAAMNFYCESTGGSVMSMQRYGDSPMPCSDSEKNLVMHGSIKVGDTVVMFSDAGEKRKINFGDNFSLAIDFKDEVTIKQAFDALSKDGNITMPLQDTFWGAVFGMCTDKFGVNWMFNYDRPKN